MKLHDLTRDTSALSGESFAASLRRLSGVLAVAAIAAAGCSKSERGAADAAAAPPAKSSQTAHPIFSDPNYMVAEVLSIVNEGEKSRFTIAPAGGGPSLTLHVEHAHPKAAEWLAVEKGELVALPYREKADGGAQINFQEVKRLPELKKAGVAPKADPI